MRRTSLAIQVLAFVAILAAGGSARGGTIRADRSDSLYTSLAALPAFACVGEFQWTEADGDYLASGVLINDQWVLTAAHVTVGVTSEYIGTMTFTIGGTTYYASQVYTNSGWNGSISNGYDIGLVRLTTAVSGVAPAVLYPTTDEYRRGITIVGYGATGTGLTGAVQDSGTKRAGTNIAGLGSVLNSLSWTSGGNDTMLVADFDTPGATGDANTNLAVPTDLEYCAAPGDSGGGWFIQKYGQYALAGVTSFLDSYPGNYQEAMYGDICGSTRVSSYLNWIGQYTTYTLAPPGSNWNVSSGLWSAAGSWTDGEPNASFIARVNNGGVATVSSTGRACSTLLIGLGAGESGTVELLSGGALTVGGAVQIGSGGGLNRRGGSLTRAGDANLGVSVQSDGNVHVYSGTYTLGALTGTDSNFLHGTTVLDTGTALNVTRIRQQSVTVGPSATLTLRGSSRTTSLVGTLALAGATNAWTATVDIKGNYLVIRDGNAATVENQVTSGMNLATGYWNGKGITSSLAAADTSFYTAVGVLDNSLAHYTTFGDATGLTGAEVLVRYTFYGDADLSGTVDFDNDYILWQTGFLNGYTGWVYGDFNHDGVVDFDNDYILWQTLFLNQPTLPAAAESAVPEPATLVLLALGGGAILRRRRG